MVFEIGDIKQQLYLENLEGRAIRMYLGSLRDVHPQRPWCVPQRWPDGSPNFWS